jgi:hypothetical protein
MTGAHHCAQPLVEMGSLEYFAWAGLKQQSSQSLPPEQQELQA